VWQLPSCAKIIGGEPSAALRGYIERHGIGWDWFYYGDLKGRQRLTRWRNLATTSPAKRQRAIDLIEEKCGKLTPEKRRIVDHEIDRLLAKQDDPPAA
jgi:hypothetical protein